MTATNRKNKRWVFLDPPAETITRLVSGSRVSPLLARLLANRGITSPEEAAEYLSPNLSTLKDPMLMKGIPEASKRLAAAVVAGETIGFACDYDSDGSNAIAILKQFFDEVGSVPSAVHLPNRFELGYGLHKEGIDELVAAGARLLVSADVGISAHETARYAREIGVELIVTDHHTPPPSLPDADVIINPLQKDCNFPYKDLCGAGVAFYLIMATRKALREQGYFTNRPEPDVRKYLDRVALATIGDVVRLTGENRKLTKAGLQIMNSTPSPGIAALMKVSGVKAVNSGSAAFSLVPRINASGRLDTAHHALNLLLASAGEEADGYAEQLDAFNKERQETDARTLAVAQEIMDSRPELLDKKTIVLASPAFHVGTHGISAQKILEQYYKPTILIAIDEEKGIGKGSCRSIVGFNIVEALAACSKHLLGFGGHKAAAGFSIKVENIESFANDIEFYASTILTDEKMVPVLEIDAVLSPGEASFSTLKEIEALEPFGMGNRAPVFAMKNMLVRGRKVLKGKHLKLQLLADGKTFEAIGFNMSSCEPDIIDLAFQLDENEWNGQKSLQLRIKDIRPATGGN